MTSRPPWFIVLLYAVLSTLWILVAGYLISLTLDDPVFRSRAYLAEELILIAISSVMFYSLLKLVRDSNTADTATGQNLARFRLNRLMLAFFSLAMVAPLVGIARRGA